VADPKFLRIPMHQGLLESQESSKVPLGFMTELVNWVPEQTGGLRARGKWFKGSEGGLPATRQNRGIGLLTRSTDPAILQVSSVSVTSPTGSASSPAPIWATPTTPGNLLLLVCTTGYVAASVSAITNTPGGSWVSAGSTTDITGTTGGKVQVFYIANAPVQTGTQTFASGTITTGVNVSARATWWLVEVSGITLTSPVDITTSATSAASTTLSMTSSATTQASEFVLMVDSAAKVSTSITLSTATTDWSEQAESSGTVFANGNTVAHSGAFYAHTALRTTGAQAITVTSTATADHAGLIVTFKGWNDDATPSSAVASFLAANDDGTNLDIYGVVDIEAGTYSIVDTDVGSSADGLPVAFVRGLGYAYYTASSFATVRRFDGVTASAVATSPIGARCIAISHDRLWAGGGTAIPSRLYYTQLLDGSLWTGTGSGFWDIGTDDGEFIEDITPFNDGMLIGKQTSLWFLSGDTTSNFARHQLPSGGAAPGRSLLTTPFGAVIAGTDQVWLYDGESVTRLGNAIEVSYGPTGFVTTSYQDGSIYIADHSAGRVYAFNLGGPVGTWRVEECADTIAVLYNLGGRQFMGPYSTTVGSLVNFRDFPAPARGKDYDPLPMSYRMRTGDLWVDGALHPSTPRQMYLQLRQRGGDPADPGLVVTPVFNGVDANDCDVGADNPGTRRVKVQGFPQKHRVGSFGFGISQTLASGDASVFDIEDAWVEYIQESTL
jgi:hypothetical protein